MWCKVTTNQVNLGFFYEFLHLTISEVNNFQMKLPPRRGRLRAIAEQQGETIELLIPRMIKEERTCQAAAQRLGVSTNTVRYWLLKLGYEAQSQQNVTWEKAEAPEAVAE